MQINSICGISKGACIFVYYAIMSKALRIRTIMASRRNLLFSIQFLKVKIFEGNQHLAESCFHTPARRLSHFGDLCDRNRQLYTLANKSLTRTRMSQFCGRRNDLHFNDNIRHAIGLSTNTSPVVQRPEVLSLSNHTVQPTSTIERSKSPQGVDRRFQLCVSKGRRRGHDWLRADISQTVIQFSTLASATNLLLLAYVIIQPKICIAHCLFGTRRTAWDSCPCIIFIVFTVTTHNQNCAF